MSASITDARLAAGLLLPLFLIAAAGCTTMSSGSAGARTFQETRVSPSPLWSRDLGRSVEAPLLEWEGSWLVAATAGPLRRIRQTDGEDLWTRKLPGEVRGAPVLIAPVLVVAVEGGKQEVVAVDLESGEPLWRSEGSASLVAGGGGRLLVIDVRGHVSRLEPATGELVWTTRLYGAGWRAPVSLPEASLWLVPVRPDSLVALDAETGARRWAAAVGAWPLVAAGLGSVYAATDDSALVRLDPSDGRLLARRTLGAMPAGPPVPGDHLIHLALRNGTLAAFGADLTTRWETTLDPPFQTPPVLSGGDLFQAGPRGCLTRVDALTGETRSEYLHAEFLTEGPAVTADRVAVVGDGGRLIVYPRGAP